MVVPTFPGDLALLPFVCMLQKGSGPDVWLQLLELCAAEPACQPTALRSLAQQLVAQQQQIAGLQGQLNGMQSLLQELLQRQQQ
jgi:hypothetical protein